MLPIQPVVLFYSFLRAPPNYRSDSTYSSPSTAYYSATSTKTPSTVLHADEQQWQQEGEREELRVCRMTELQILKFIAPSHDDRLDG